MSLRHVLLTLALTAALALNAEPPAGLALGLSYNRATEYHQNGIGLKLQLPIYQRFAIEGEIIYFSQKHETTTLHLNLHALYHFPLIQRLTVYPFAGVGYSHWGYTGPNASHWGANLGGGADVHLNRAWGIFAEARLQLVSHESQLIATLGIRHRF